MEALQKILPWILQLGVAARLIFSAIVVLTALFVLVVLWIPQASAPTQTEREIAHRLVWIHDHLQAKPLLVEDAYEAKFAISGGGGRFRPTTGEYKDISLPPLASREGRYSSTERDIRDLERILAMLPSSYRPGQEVESTLSEQLFTIAQKLPK